ncbi:MAG TPA: DNA internalization-related competence protein ComEC/Rec2 [Burkholderiales bacterium]
MTGAALAFAAGAWGLQQQAGLPPAVAGWLLLLLGALAVAAVKRSRTRPKTGAVALVLAALAAGFLWAATLAHHRLADRLDPALEARDIVVRGVVTGLPVSLERGVRFEFDIESPAGLPARVRLAWYGEPPPEVLPGERWQFTVRLRAPHGQANPGGFDYEAWLLERGIGATGSVRPRATHLRLGLRGSFMDGVARLRSAVSERFRAVLGARPAAGVLAALAVGDQNAIAAEEWRLFQRTGVTHLMSISGLHVTLVSGLVALLVGFGWRRAPALALALPARKAGAAAALVAALGYTLLAGFGIPAQRTFFMVSVVALALWSGRVASPARVLALALLAVVALDPWAPLAPGFWLSFGAVALIFWTAVGWNLPEARPLQWVRVQWAITLGLAPAVLLLFNQVSLVGPLANALAIPLVSLVITPLALLAAIVPIDPLLHAAAWLTEWLLVFLEACASMPLALWQGAAPPGWAVALAIAGVLWMLAPRGVPWRVSGLALLAPAFLLPPPVPVAGQAWVTVLDVGQGLAVLVRTAGHALLYDAGPAWGGGSGTDSGERVVLPVLAAQGVSRLDAMVLTHQDSDHVGGAQSVLQALEVDRLLSSLEDSHPALGLAASRAPCLRGMAWTWDGVRFEVLHPAPRASRPAMRATRSNDRSCVLRIEAGATRLLLTADIEHGAEAELLAQAASRLPADIVLVPHHGSRTSSTAAFVEAVRPDWAVVPVGHGNRFGHPAPEVVARWMDAGARVLRTDRHGAVHLRFGGTAPAIEAERARRPRYWRAAPRADLSRTSVRATTESTTAGRD